MTTKQAMCTPSPLPGPSRKNEGESAVSDAWATLDLTVGGQGDATWAFFSPKLTSGPLNHIYYLCSLCS